jgi:hypothetical protein
MAIDKKITLRRSRMVIKKPTQSGRTQKEVTAPKKWHQPDHLQQN